MMFIGLLPVPIIDMALEDDGAEKKSEEAPSPPDIIGRWENELVDIMLFVDMLFVDMLFEGAI